MSVGTELAGIIYRLSDDLRGQLDREDAYRRSLSEMTATSLRLELRVQELEAKLAAMESQAAGDIFTMPEEEPKP